MVKTTQNDPNIAEIADNIDTSGTNLKILKQFMVAAVVDLITYSPQIMSKLGALDNKEQLFLSEANNFDKTHDLLEGRKSKQSCVLNVIKQNPHLITSIISPIMTSVPQAPIIQYGYDTLQQIKESLSSNVTEGREKPLQKAPIIPTSLAKSKSTKKIRKR